MKSYATVAPSVDEWRRRAKAKVGRKKTVTVATIHSLLPDAETAEDRVRLRRVALEIGGDPLGIRSGQYGQRARYGVGELTAERMQRVRRGGGWVSTEQEKTAAGGDTGLQRKRIKSPIEVWFERGAISRASWLAAMALQRDHDLSISCTGAMIAKYEATVGVAHKDLMGAEASVEFMMAKEAAIRAVSPRYYVVLAWIMACSNDDVPPELPAKRYYPQYSDREAVTRFKGIFEMACAALAQHYQHKEKHQWATGMAAETARELLPLLPA